jgi:hypothetical protein
LVRVRGVEKGREREVGRARETRVVASVRARERAKGRAKERVVVEWYQSLLNPFASGKATVLVWNF